jgi:hypothetical protein
VGLGPFPDFEPTAIPPSSSVSPPAGGAYVGGTGGPYLHTVERSPESFPAFAFFLKGYGFIPNLFRAQTLRADVLEAEAAAVREILQPEDIYSRSQKECILVGSAAAQNKAPADKPHAMVK